MRLIATILVSALTATPAIAQRYNGPTPSGPSIMVIPQRAQTTPQNGASGPSAIDLMKLCFAGSDDGTINNPSCVGYLAGFVGAVRIARSVTADFPICLPEGSISNQSIVSDVSSYLETHEEQLPKSARSILFLVLSRKYPCQ